LGNRNIVQSTGGKGDHQQDIEGQYVHVDGLEREDQSLVERLCRIGHEAGDVELILEIRIARLMRRVPPMTNPRSSIIRA
jgi:hypothetical protein